MNKVHIFQCMGKIFSEPLFYANRILSIKDINFYAVFMYNCMSNPLPGIFTDFCVPKTQTMSATGMTLLMQVTCMFPMPDWTLENLV